MSVDGQSARDRILTKVRAALGTPSRALPPAPAGRGLFPPLDAATLAAEFGKQLLAVSGVFHRAASVPEAREILRGIAEAAQAQQLGVASGATVRAVCESLPARLLGSHGDGHALQDLDIAVTGCDCLIARTGSVVLTARSAAGRASSVLPPVHVVVAGKNQLVADLADALQVLDGRYRSSAQGWPSMMTVITGPSRTADIEKTLVLGAHGPKQLHVVLLDSPVEPPVSAGGAA